VIVSAPDLRQFIELCIGEIPADAQFIGRAVDGVAAFFNREWANVEIAYAGEPGWLTPDLVRLGFRYVFDVLGCNRCTARIEADNAYSLHLAKRFGFVEEGRVRGLKNGRDVIILGMLKEECRHGWRKQQGRTDANGRSVGNDPAERTGKPRQHGRPVRVADLHHGR
jgi:hypothetical protein